MNARPCAGAVAGEIVQYSRAPSIWRSKEALKIDIGGTLRNSLPLTFTFY